VGTVVIDQEEISLNKHLKKTNSVFQNQTEQNIAPFIESHVYFLAQKSWTVTSWDCIFLHKSEKVRVRVFTILLVAFLKT